MDLYQQYIHISRYSRYRDDLGRRETWPETVQRYVDFFDKRTEHAYSSVMQGEVRDAILNLRAMPSMRALMTAGPALERENLAAFNCSYLACNTKRSFSEALYILMCGTGVGFSCERQEIAKLPTIPSTLQQTDSTIVVADSKEGWAKSFQALLSNLWNGDIPKVDYSKVRASGERLKTFGGRASGPDPLRKLFDFSVELFKKAAGRKLTSIEVHDMMCMIGEIVVVGGVRRSALISLSNLSDQRMRDAKSGQWWQTAPHRALANNSVSYTEKPDASVFMEEWLSLVKSGSGERGIFNRSAAQKQAAKWGRRSADHEYGCNPCLTGDTLLLTEFGLRPLHELAGYENSFRIMNADGEWSESDVVETGVKPVKHVVLSNGLEFKATEDHLVAIMVKKSQSASDYNQEKTVKVDDLYVGMKMRALANQTEWSGIESFNSIKQATLAGLMFGDGYNDHGRLAIATSEPEVIDFVNEMVPGAVWDCENTKKTRLPIGVLEDLQSRGISFARLPERDLPVEFFGWSSITVKAFLKGLYSANGALLDKHNRITLKATNLRMVKDVQKVLSALGFSAYITTNKPSVIQWENGEYESRESYDLNVGGAAECDRFQKEIGFLYAHKMLARVVSAGKKTTRVATIVSITDLPAEPVFDFVEPKTSWAWVNGLKIHNCSEIILRDKQLCNLTEVIARADDTLDTLRDKVRVAAILGTLQASLTDFKFVGESWHRNTADEALLGVSITGIMDNHLLAGKQGADTLKTVLNELRDYAREVNAEWAEKLGIKPSAAITCVKPSGTVSQLCNTASGIHARHNRNYIRTVRIDKKDPLYSFMLDKGFYIEDDAMRPDSTAVVSFPMTAPTKAITRDEVGSIEALDLWLLYQREWCEHKPSITVSVKDQDWLKVGSWVYEHFDEVSGVSFLPHTDHTYQQAPYQDMTEDQMADWISRNPQPEVNWADLVAYEKTDNTAGSQTLACVAGVCELPGT